MREKADRLKANAGYARAAGAKHPLDLPIPTGDQQAIIDHPARFKVLACGRRWGKTVIDIRVLAQQAIEGETWGYFSMTYRNLAECYRELKVALAPYTLRSSQTEGRIELHEGGLLEFWSLQTTNKDTARGRKYHGVVIDEAAFIPNGDYVWNSVIRPTLADMQGAALLTSSTNGRNHFFEWYQRGVDKLQYPDWQSWNYPTAANPLITADELESIRQQTPDLFYRQEYLAEFLEGQGVVFRYIDERCTAFRLSPYDGRFVFGVDWAQMHDYTVIVVLDTATKTVVDYDRFNGVDWALQRGRLRTLYDRWKPFMIWAESNSVGSPNIEALQREGLPVRSFETTASSKPPLIESLVLAFDRGEITALNDPVMKGELMAYERKVSPTTGRSQYSAPDGLHDDVVMALALAWHGAGKSLTLPIILDWK